ncbi:hypothetical protein Scep_029767 [Stephania cephalantha]|uniref:Uncharacterized protein n=1 Tax=Stephania cephalantha TaxID=152367 RepID=A0AAP0HGA4_9MAGN
MARRERERDRGGQEREREVKEAPARSETGGCGRRLAAARQRAAARRREIGNQQRAKRVDSACAAARDGARQAHRAGRGCSGDGVVNDVERRSYDEPGQGGLRRLPLS